MGNKFVLQSDYGPAGDQPGAIERLSKNIAAGAKHQVLLGVTGSGKTFTMASVIERAQKPALIISHNKTLAAQLYQEFKEFFPKSSVHYFVSYYDYYQPEAYMPTTDTYIDKDVKINEELDRLRHQATQAILSGSDVVVVASVSCIYNIGSPADYEGLSLDVKRGQKISRKEFLAHLVKLQYGRNDIEQKPGTFRVRGEVVEIVPAGGREIMQIEFFGNEVENIERKYDSESFKHQSLDAVKIFPAKYWLAPDKKIKMAAAEIKRELKERVAYFKKRKKPLEAERIGQRTNYDLELLKETGYCHGIENYSRYMDFRPAGSPPFTLIDYFHYAYGDDFLMFIDESHMTIPQIGGMYHGDRARKQTLIEYGFRMPSALDNRPLRFYEFEKLTTRMVYVSATPAEYEMGRATVRGDQTVRGPTSHSLVVEQVIRPTGLLDPRIEVRGTKNQVRDLIKEIRGRVKKRQRILVTVLTKRLAEDMAEFLQNEDIKTCWLHSEVKTLERTEILRDLREGRYDVLVGVNLLREGLDLPEVSLVAILDADKEGFLRNATTLIQTAGRASRHPDGTVIMYADRITRSMGTAIDETSRRRGVQEKYNKAHGVKPRAIKKAIRENIISGRHYKVHRSESEDIMILSDALNMSVPQLEKEMRRASKDLDFERAAVIRDRIRKTK